MGVHIVNGRKSVRDVLMFVLTMFFGAALSGGAALFGMFLLGIL